MYLLWKPKYRTSVMQSKVTIIRLKGSDLYLGVVYCPGVSDTLRVVTMGSWICMGTMGGNKHQATSYTIKSRPASALHRDSFEKLVLPILPELPYSTKHLVQDAVYGSHNHRNCCTYSYFSFTSLHPPPGSSNIYFFILYTDSTHST